MGLDNKSISQIIYFATYILIVTIVMKNFADIINMVKASIESLVGFMNCLLPILITLMLATGSIASATMLQPLNTIYNHINGKYNYEIDNTIFSNINSFKYSCKHFRQDTNK